MEQLASPRERLVRQALAGQVEQVEDDVADGLGEERPPTRAARVTAHESVEIRAAVADDNQLAVEHRAGRQFAEDDQLGIPVSVKAKLRVQRA
jgi:hypothetical protein